MKEKLYILAFVICAFLFSLPVHAVEILSFDAELYDTSALTQDEDGIWWLDDSGENNSIKLNSSTGLYESYDEASVIYTFSVNVSGEEYYEAGAITLEVPAYLFSSRDGSTGYLAAYVSIPAKGKWKSTSSSDWYYYYNDDGNMVISNGREIDGSSEILIQVAYTGTYFCSDIEDGSASTAEPAIFTVNDVSQDVSLPTIYYTSSVAISSLSASSTVYDFYPDDSMWSGVEPDDSDDYIWVVSTFTANMSANTQLADFVVEAAADSEGTIYATYAKTYSSSGICVVYVLTQYSKNTVQDEAIHTLKTTATVTATGVDDLVATSATATTTNAYEYTGTFLIDSSATKYTSYPTASIWADVEPDNSDAYIYVVYSFDVYVNADTDTVDLTGLVTDSYGTVLAARQYSAVSTTVYNTGSKWTTTYGSSYSAHDALKVVVKYLVQYPKSEVQDTNSHTLSLQLTAAATGKYNHITKTKTASASTTYVYENLYAITSSATLYTSYPSSSIWADVEPDDDYAWVVHTFNIYVGIDTDLDNLDLTDVVTDSYGTMYASYLYSTVSTGTVYWTGSTWTTSYKSGYTAYSCYIVKVSYLVQYDLEEVQDGTTRTFSMRLTVGATGKYAGVTTTKSKDSVITYGYISTSSGTSSSTTLVQPSSSYSKSAGMSTIYMSVMENAGYDLQIYSGTIAVLGEGSITKDSDGNVISVEDYATEYQVELIEGVPYATLSSDSDADAVYFEDDDYEYAYIAFTSLPKTTGYDEDYTYISYYEPFLISYYTEDREWVEYCTVDYENDLITYTDGTTESYTDTIYFPSGAKQIKVGYTCEEMFTTVKYVSAITLLNTDNCVEMLNTYSYFWQHGTVEASGTYEYTDSDKGYDTAETSYTTPTYSMSGTATGSVDNQMYTIKYTVTAGNTLTNITDAMATAGYGSYDKYGTLYVLLPQGAKFQSVEENYVRNYMSVSINYTYVYSTTNNWRGTGRTMVEINYDCTDEFPYYLSFYVTCTYSYEAVYDYGSSAYASSMIYLEDTDLFVVTTNMDDNQGGDLSDAEALAEIYDDDEVHYMYASVTKTCSATYTATLSLYERVQGSYDDTWTTGLYSTVIAARSGSYTYKLHFGASTKTSSKNNVLYMNLETYKNSAWHGYLESIDTSQAESKGASPVIYYSTVGYLDFSSDDNRDLTDTSIWSTEIPDDTSTITAIAIDLSEDENGDEFVLDAGETISILVYMTAPDETSSAEGYANSNVYLSNTLMDTSGNVTSETNLIYYNYVRIMIEGLDPIEVTVTIPKIIEDTANTGRTAAEGEFEFALYAEDSDEAVATTTNDADENVTFVIEVGQSGTYTYTVKEIAGDNDTITYSDAETSITFTVKNSGGEYVVTDISVETSNG